MEKQNLMSKHTSARFSAIIPNYNHGGFILNTLDAAMGQTAPFDEIIVIDDASTDNSLALIEAYIRDIPHARLIRNPHNMGVIGSSNLGLKEATGDFICYLSADDDYDQHLVEWCHNVLRQYPDVAMISGNTCIHNVMTGERHDLVLPFEQKIAHYSRQHIEAVSKKRAFSFCIGANVIRRDAIIAAGEQIEALKWHADWFLYLLIASRYSFGVSPNEFLTVRKVSGQYSNACNDWGKQRPVIEAFIRSLRKDYPTEYAFFRRCVFMPTYDFAALDLLLRKPDLRHYLTPLLAWRLLSYKPLRTVGRWLSPTLRARVRQWLKV